jgi:hypothetical protein
MTREDLDLIIRGIAAPIRERIDLDIKNALEPLQARIKALEARPDLAYRGIWRDGEAYGAGSLATVSGALWLATRATTMRPGTSDSGWRLIVKSGGA